MKTKHILITVSVIAVLSAMGILVYKTLRKKKKDKLLEKRGKEIGKEIFLNQ